MKQNDKITLDIAGKHTPATVLSIDDDGTIHAVIDDKTLVSFKTPSVRPEPKRNILQSFFSIKSSKQDEWLESLS